MTQRLSGTLSDPGGDPYTGRVRGFFILILPLVLAGCLGTGTSAKPVNGHGGFTGTAANYYDVGFKMCRKQALASNSKTDNLLTFLVAAPDKYQGAAQKGCDAGQASARRMLNCESSEDGNTSSLDCVYRGTPDP